MLPFWFEAWMFNLLFAQEMLSMSQQRRRPRLTLIVGGKKD